jgi:hypothetical protein
MDFVLAPKLDGRVFLTGNSFFKGFLLKRVSFASFATRSLETKAKLVEEPLALPNTKRYGIILGKVMRQQRTIPQILVVSQLSGGTTDIFAQFCQLMSREPGWAASVAPLHQAGKSIRSKSLYPVFNSSRRVSVQTGCFIRAGSSENLENGMESVEVAPFRRSRYFILNGSLECLGIGNIYPFHWEPPNILYSQYT